MESLILFMNGMSFWISGTRRSGQMVNDSHERSEQYMIEYLLALA